MTFVLALLSIQLAQAEESTPIMYASAIGESYLPGPARPSSIERTPNNYSESDLPSLGKSNKSIQEDAPTEMGLMSKILIGVAVTAVIAAVAKSGDGSGGGDAPAPVPTGGGSNGGNTGTGGGSSGDSNGGSTGGGSTSDGGTGGFSWSNIFGRKRR